MARAKLEDYLVAHHYVGRFIWYWANLETALYKAMQTALDLDGAQVAILMANIQLRDKLNILKTLLDAYDHEKAPALIKVLNAIGTYSVNRNMMAHDFHGPMVEEDGDTVRFYSIKAKGKLDLPKNIWSEADFEAAYAKIEDFRAALVEGMDAFRHPGWDDSEDEPATEERPQPEATNALYLPPQSPRDPQSASPKTDAQTRPDPKQK